MSSQASANRPARQALTRSPIRATRSAASTEPPALREAWAGFLGRWSWDWFATLTFRSDVHPEAAAKRFHVWESRINRQLYGRRWSKHGRGIRWVRASESQRRGVIHFHAMIGGPKVDELRRLSWMDEWADLAGWARIEPPRSAVAVQWYCAKYVVKGGEVDLGGRLDAPDPEPSLWSPEGAIDALEAAQAPGGAP